MHCYSAPIYNLANCRLTDEFCRAFATLILLKEVLNFESPCCSTLEDLSIDVRQNTSQNSISNFFEKKNQIFGFPCCSTQEDLSIDVSITDVGLILTKLIWFQLFSTSKNSMSNLLQEKKKHFFWFPCCSTRKDLSIDVSITKVGLILTKPGWSIFSGYGQTDGQTDTISETSYGNMSAHKKFQLKAQN